MGTSPQSVPGPDRPDDPALARAQIPGRHSEPRARLVVELNRATAAELDDLVELEELNKTTIVNKALQVYAILRKAERDGGKILLVEAAGAAPERLRFL
jgi:hypothetical protein